jgi:hypothetical protein
LDGNLDSVLHLKRKTGLISLLSTPITTSARVSDRAVLLKAGVKVKCNVTSIIRSSAQVYGKSEIA